MEEVPNTLSVPPASIQDPSLLNYGYFVEAGQFFSEAEEGDGPELKKMKGGWMSVRREVVE